MNVLCAAGQVITHVNYDKPGHPRAISIGEPAP